jgi:hypothetical protein
MPLTTDFEETLRRRTQRDAIFRQALLTEAIGQLLSGELEIGKAMLRAYIKATIARTD